MLNVSPRGLTRNDENLIETFKVSDLSFCLTKYLSSGPHFTGHSTIHDIIYKVLFSKIFEIAMALFKFKCAVPMETDI